MRPIFCGNFEYDTRQSELERLFGRYGRVERVDMKSGFAFVYMDDERDARDAIHYLHNSEFGRQRRRLSVEWARGDRGVRRDAVRPASTKPTKTLFVINFDPFITKVRDLEKHFEPYGKLSHVRIRRNFAFVQFETQEEATKAIECTHMSKLLDRVIAVEYAIRDDDERDAPRDSPGRRGYGRRGSPAYGRSVSPGYGRSARRPSPDYGRGVSPYGRPARRPSPDYGRGPSPIRDRYRAPVSDHHRSPVYDDRHRSPVFVGRHRSPVFDRYRSRSPRRSRT